MNEEFKDKRHPLSYIAATITFFPYIILMFWLFTADVTVVEKFYGFIHGSILFLIIGYSGFDLFNNNKWYFALPAWIIGIVIILFLNAFFDISPYI